MPHSHELKLARALEHLDRAEAEMLKWIQCNVKVLSTEFDHHTGEDVVMLHLK
jgi:hypothetical protein